MATNLPAFNMHRVLEDYVRGVYRPAAAAGDRLASDNLAPARRLAAWKKQVRDAWPGVRLRSAVTCPLRIGFGERLGLKVAAQLHGLLPTDARVELVLTRQLPDGEHQTPPLRSFAEGDSHRVRGGHQQAVLPFIFTGETDADGAQIYEIDCLPPWCGQLTAEARIVPHHELLSHPYEMGLMKWL
jgi:starch phosphorylase